MHSAGSARRAIRATGFASLVLLLAGRARAQQAQPPVAGGEAPRPAASCAEAAAQLDRRLAAHRFFSQIAYAKDESHPSLVFLVQKPAKPRANYEASVVAMLGPWLDELRRVFEERVVQPLALVRRADWPCTAVCVLLSPGDYYNYSRTIDVPTSISGSAHFDHVLRLTTGFVDELGREPAHRRRFPLLREHVRALLAAYATAPPMAQTPLWVEEGLASYLAFHIGIPPVSLQKREIDPRAFDELWDLVHDEGSRSLYLLHFEELAAIGSWSEIGPALAPRFAQSRAKLDLGKAWRLFDVQAQLWTHFLLDSQGAKHRSAHLAFVKSVLAGRGARDDLRAAFAGSDLRALEVEFHGWALASFLALHPGNTAGFDPAIDLFPAAAFEEVPTPVLPALEKELATLAPRADDLEARLGLALRRASSGAFESAANELDEIAREAAGGALAPRCERELARLRAFLRLRDAHLRGLVASGGKLAFEYEGKKVLSKVKRYAAGQLELEDNRAGLRSISAEELDAAELARSMEKPLLETEDGWVRWLPYALAGDERIFKLLRDASGESAALRDDAQSAYPAALALGDAADALAGLSSAGVPRNPTSAKIALDRIRRLLAHRELALVSPRLGLLKRLAGAAFEASIDESRLQDALGGKLETLGEGRVRVTYEFDDPLEALDWIPDERRFAWWRKGIELRHPESESGFVPREGALQGSGSATLRWAVELEHPIVASYTVRYDQMSENGPEPGRFMVAVCDSGKESYVGCSDFGWIHVMDAAGGTFGVDKDLGAFSYVPGEDYQIELRVEDGVATSHVDGEARARVDCPGWKSGGVLFAAYTDLPLQLKRLVLEGKLSSAGMGKLKRRCAERELAKLGF